EQNCRSQPLAVIHMSPHHQGSCSLNHRPSQQTVMPLWPPLLAMAVLCITSATRPANIESTLSNSAEYTAHALLSHQMLRTPDIRASCKAFTIAISTRISCR